VDRFELENGPIMLYKALEKYQKRISSIKKILDKYNKEQFKKINNDTSNQDRTNLEGGNPEDDAVQGAGLE
jgi:hypothetical protein